jgi:hypothetical protein
MIGLAALTAPLRLFAADSYTPNYGLRLPDLDIEDEETPWGEKYNNNFTLLDTAVESLAVSTGSVQAQLDAVVLSTGAIQVQLDAVAVSTGVLNADLATEVSDRQIADAAIAVSTGANAAAIAALEISTAALEAAKMNRAGDTMTGQLNVSSNIVAASSMTASYIQGGGANFPLPVTGISLTEIEDLTANKVFTMGNKTLEWQFTNPSGGMKWDFTGAAAGHSLEIMQETGNPSTDMHLLHIHAEDPDPVTLHLVPGGTTSRALMVHANGDTLTNAGRFEMTGAGAMAWGDGGAGGADTNLYRAAANSLKTDDSMTASAFYGNGANLTGVIQSTATGTYSLSTTGNAATVTNGLYTTTSFSGDVTGNYNTTVVGDNSHLHSASTLQNVVSTGTAFSGDVTGTYNATVVGDNSHLHSASTLQNVVSTGTTFGGDVSGTYNAIAVTDDSHSHSASTLTGVIQSTATGTYSLSTTGNAATVTNGLYTTTSFSGDVTGNYNSTVVGDNSHTHNQTTVTGVIYSTATGTYGISITGNAATATTTTGNAATATKLLNARTINGVSFDGTANINIATTSYLADEVSLALTGATFSAKSSSVTLQGNTFNGANQLVKLDALSKLPAVDGSQLLNLPSTSGGAVLASTQTFTGGNTFAGATVLASATVNNLYISSNSYQVLGIGQSWQVVTRTSGTTYTNDTGRPIMLNVGQYLAQPSSYSISVKGVQVANATISATYGNQSTMSVIIPPGDTYIVTGSAGYVATELR